MAVFITGGHGHIASWAARFLAEAGEHVILYDINPTTPDLDAIEADIDCLVCHATNYNWAGRT